VDVTVSGLLRVVQRDVPRATPATRSPSATIAVREYLDRIDDDPDDSFRLDEVPPRLGTRAVMRRSLRR
jgi:hypothetical protein